MLKLSPTCCNSFFLSFSLYFSLPYSVSFFFFLFPRAPWRAASKIIPRTLVSLVCSLVCCFVLFVAVPYVVYCRFARLIHRGIVRLSPLLSVPLEVTTYNIVSVLRVCSVLGQTLPLRDRKTALTAWGCESLLRGSRPNVLVWAVFRFPSNLLRACILFSLRPFQLTPLVAGHYFGRRVSFCSRYQYRTHWSIRNKWDFLSLIGYVCGRCKVCPAKKRPFSSLICVVFASPLFSSFRILLWKFSSSCAYDDLFSRARFCAKCATCPFCFWSICWRVVAHRLFYVPVSTLAKSPIRGRREHIHCLQRPLRAKLFYKITHNNIPTKAVLRWSISVYVYTPVEVVASGENDIP